MMDAELVKKRIASYMHGNITREELEAFIDSFGDALAEEIYTEFLFERFEEYLTAEPHEDAASESEEASEPALRNEEKKQKSAQSGRSMYVRISFCISVAASFLLKTLYNFECNLRKPKACIDDYFLTLTE